MTAESMHPSTIAMHDQRAAVLDAGLRTAVGDFRRHQAADGSVSAEIIMGYAVDKTLSHQHVVELLARAIRHLSATDALKEGL